MINQKILPKNDHINTANSKTWHTSGDLNVSDFRIRLYLPSHTFNGFVRLDLYDKNDAVEKCVDEFQGEIPHSE